MVRVLELLAQLFLSFLERVGDVLKKYQPQPHTVRGAISGLLRKRLGLALLEPAVIQAILTGQQPRCMSLLWFQRNPLPTDWVAQREVVARFDA